MKEKSMLDELKELLSTPEKIKEAQEWFSAKEKEIENLINEVLMEKFYMILRLSDNSYLTNNGPWDDSDEQWSKDQKNARKFESEAEIEIFVQEDQREEDKDFDENAGYNQLGEDDFLILTGFTTKKY